MGLTGMLPAIIATKISEAVANTAGSWAGS